MVGYPISLQDLTQLVEDFNDGKPKTGNKGTVGKRWLAKAKKATDECRQAGSFVDKGNIWSEIKEVFIKHQSGKCCYCEKQLEGLSGKKDYDVEHFRPKGRVRDWFADKGNALLPDFPGIAASAQAQATGYYLLAYHLRNYAAACSTCNSNLKSDYFPTHLDMVLGDEDASTMDAAELPYLIFPLADWGPKPEDLIQFEGLTALPRVEKQDDPRRYWQARVTIAFFLLNRDRPLHEPVTPDNREDEGRENLYRMRAEALDALATAISALEDQDDQNSPKARNYKRKIAGAVLPDQPHSNCCASFLRLWNNDRTKAIAIWSDVNRYLYPSI